MSGGFYCADVSSYECEAPAGIRAGSRVGGLPGVRKRDLLECGYCHELVCQKCSDEIDGKPVCLGHEDDELLKWLDLLP